MRALLILIVLGSFRFIEAQTLDASIQTALEKSPEIKAKRAAFEASLQKLPQVSSLPDPEVSLSFFVGQMMLPMGNQLGNLTVMQMFPWFGVLDAQKNAAARMAEVEYQELAVAASELTLKVKNAWYPLEAVAEKIRLQEQLLQVLQTDKDLAVVKFQNDQAPMTDALRTDIMTEEVKTDIVLLALEKQRLTTVLNSLLNRSLDTPVDVEGRIEWEPLTMVEEPDGQWIQNPQLMTLDKQLEAAQAQEVVAGKMRLPSISTGITYMALVKRYSHVHLEPNTGADMVMPMVSVTIPIWQKKYHAAIQESKWNQIYWQEMKKETMNDLSVQYEQAHFEWEKARKIIELMNVQLGKIQQLIDLSLASYGNGGLDLESILTLQRQQLRYQMEKVEALTQGRLSVAKMAWLMGKQ